MYLGWMILRFSNHMRIKRECVTLAYINICSKNPRKVDINTSMKNKGACASK